MTLYLIGIGLGNERDITLKGLDIIQKCKKIYVESYTSRLVAQNISAMEKLYGKKITLADRTMVEEDAASILDEAKMQDIALLIIGSPFSATTHIEFLLMAKKEKIPVYVIENASILTAIGITGLFLYKFGRTTTIPFDNKNITSPYEFYLENKKQGLHTLFLLDIQEKKMMTAREGLDYLIKQGLPKAAKVIGCAALGSENPEICVGAASALALTKFPQCLIIPGTLNFKEEEALNLYNKEIKP